MVKTELIGSPEKFYSKIVNIGNSKGVIIPYQMLKANGWEEGQDVVVWIKKLVKMAEDEKD